MRTFTQSAGAVTAEIVKHGEVGETVTKAEFSYLIGADGAHSIVRKTLGLPFLGETREEDNIAVGDIVLISEPREVCFIYLLLKSFLTFIRLVLGALDDRNCHVSFTSTQ